MKLIAVFLCFFFSLPLHAAEALPMQEFGNLPIAHAGRIKPLSVFAREQLRYFSGKEEFRKRPGIHWLASLLFAPEGMEHAPLLLVQSEALRETLGLSPQTGHLYSLQSLRLAMQQHMPLVLEALLLVERKQPTTALQEEIVTLYAKLGRIQQLQESFAFALPFPALPKETLDSLSEKQRHKHQALVQQMEERGNMSTILAILPTQWKGKQDWYSPWALRFNGLGSPQLAAYQNNWLELLKAYRTEDGEGWETALIKAHQTLDALAAPSYSPLKVTLEEWYYKLSFLSLAVVFYILFIVMQFFNVTPTNAGVQKLRMDTRLRGYDMLKYSPLLLGMGFHAAALLVRMVILGRPPVSNLYESLLFVSFLVTMAGAFIAWREQKNIIGVAAAGSAAGLLLLSQILLEGQEHLPVVMAVLNTNFWLGTHVICITSGYAAAVITSLYAHYVLWRFSSSSSGNPLFSTSEASSQKSEISGIQTEVSGFQIASLINRITDADSAASGMTALRKLNFIAIIALLLTAVGTLLGGIWADQSWGRFWGWDPKENGAMLIVLWLIWLIHGKLVGQVSARWYLAGMCYLSVTVALAWFGVNLLSVGLHSYGFTEGTAIGLFCFIILQTAVIGWLLWRQREARHA